MLRLRATVLAVLLVVAGYTTAQYTRSAWDPQPAPLRIPAVEAAYHPKVDPTSYWNYQRSGRTPSRSMLSKMMTSAGAITLQGPGSTSGSPTFKNLTWTGDATGTWVSFASAGTNTFSGATPLNLTASTASVFFNNASATAGYIFSGCSATNCGATATTAAIKITPTITLDATDWVLSVNTVSDGSSLFNVAYNGAVTAASTISTPGTVSGNIVQATTKYQIASRDALVAGQVTTNDTAMFGSVADSAGNAAIVLTNINAMTSGQDRYIALLSRGANGANVVGRVFTDGTYQNLATVGTAGSGTGITSNFSGAVRGFVHEITIINTALTAAATTDVTVWSATPVDTRLVRVTGNVTQVFTGGALSAMTVVCGKTAGGTDWTNSVSVFTAQTTIGDVAAEIGSALTPATWADMGTPAAGVPGALAVICRFTCTGANCNAATQGSVKFKIEGVTY